MTINESVTCATAIVPVAGKLPKTTSASIAVNHFPLGPALVTVLSRAIHSHDSSARRRWHQRRKQ